MNTKFNIGQIIKRDDVITGITIGNSGVKYQTKSRAYTEAELDKFVVLPADERTCTGEPTSAGESQPIAPQEDKAKFKVGDRIISVREDWTTGVKGTVLIVGANDLLVSFDRYVDPSFPRGENKFCAYQNEKEIEPYAEPEQPKLTVTREMLEKLGACTGGISTFDRLFPSGSGDLKDVCEQAEKSGHADYSSWLTSCKDRIAEMQNEQPKEAVKLYCVKDYVGSNALTKGKTYEFDGFGVTYDNEFRGAGRKTFEEWKLKNPEVASCLVPLVKRPAKVWEWVLIVDAKPSASATRYENGDILKITHYDMRFAQYEKSVGGYLNEGEYLVLDGYTPEPEKEPEPVYFSGKVVCIEPHVGFLTKGKAYTFKDGLSKDDTGDLYPFSGIPFKTVADLSNHHTAKFIPYLGEA